MKKKLWIIFGAFAVLLGSYTQIDYSAAKGIDFDDADIAELVVYQGDKEIAGVSDPQIIETFSPLFASETLRKELLCTSQAVSEKDCTGPSGWLR